MMRVRRSFINWGIFLICLGAVPLAVQLGVMDRGTAGELVRLWPLIIIGIGLGLILRFTPLEALGGVVVAGTFGLLFGVLFAGGFPGGFVGCPGGSASGTTVTRNGTFTESPTLNLELTCADFAVSRAPETAWTVQATTSQTAGIDSTGTSLTLRSAANGAPFMGNARESWQVTMPDILPIAANITLNASKGTFSLTPGSLAALNATFNASDTRIDLSQAQPGGAFPAYFPGRFGATYNASSGTLLLPKQGFSGDITLNASSLRLCAASDTELAITDHETLSSQNFASAGMVRSGDTWVTPDYNSTGAHVVLSISANVSSITLDRSGGCQ
jgi:hypothetical protein